jgi:hypothetical protein
MESEAAAKRARESGDAVELAPEGAGEQAGISAVVPGWFSEISLMWPGASLIAWNLVPSAAACSCALFPCPTSPVPHCSCLGEAFVSCTRPFIVAGT